MVWACGKNGEYYILQKQEGGTRETEVSLDGWCEGGFGQQRKWWRQRVNAQKIGKSGKPMYICN